MNSQQPNNKPKTFNYAHAVVNGGNPKKNVSPPSTLDQKAKQPAASKATLTDTASATLPNSTTATNTKNKEGVKVKVAGLENLHNTCYFNSILQCLIQIQTLTSYFLSKSSSSASSYQWEKKAIFDKQQNKNATAQSDNEHDLIASYISFLQSVTSNSSSSTNAIVTPVQLLSSVKKELTLFDNYDQHDPHEFCSFFINALGDSLNRRYKTPFNCKSNRIGMSANRSTTHQNNSSSGDNGNDDGMTKCIQFWKDYLQSNDSIIVDNMQGLLQNNIKCPECHFSPITFDPYSILSLPLPSQSSSSSTNTKFQTPNMGRSNTISIYDCLNEFNKSSTLDDCNTWYCTNCQNNVNAKQSISIYTCPNVLIFHLKRFTNIGRYKDHRHIVFPIEEVLDMRSYVYGPDPGLDGAGDGDGDESAFQYKLFGVCNHEGQSVHSGHYTSIIRDKHDEWYKCNDRKVEPIHYTNHTMMSHGLYEDYKTKNGTNVSTPYLLFYQRIQHNGNQNGNQNDKNNNKNDVVDYNIKWGGMGHYLNSTTRKSSAPVDGDGFTTVVPSTNKKKNRKRR